MLDLLIGMLDFIHLDESSETPLYRQVSDQIRHAIKAGNISSGDRLPPTRELAGLLGLNRATVSAAYSVLESDGLIEGQVGRGSFVRAAGTLAPAERQIISFASSRPSDQEFPIAAFQSTCGEVTSDPRVGSILQLGAPMGYGPLRHYLMQESLREGVAGESDDILITSGCQQAFDLIQRVAARQGSAAIVEDPVYHGVRQVFSRDGVRLAGIGMGPGGIRIEELGRAVAEIRPAVLVVTPTFQNPTGATMPIEARRHVLALAERFNVTVVENDIYGTLRYEGETLPTLKQLDTSGSVVLLRSFSKIAFPGLRVGWVIGARSLIARLAEARQWCDLHTDQLSQAILLRFAESGRLDAHLDRVRRAGAERLKAALEACERHLPAGSEYTRPSGGMNLWVRLPSPLNAVELLPRAERESVTYLPGSHFAVASSDPSALRLSFGSLRPDTIRSGIATLGRIFSEELERSRIPRQFEAASALV
jgi:DNA-binding transcriptional MocR family regulator